MVPENEVPLLHGILLIVPNVIGPTGDVFTEGCLRQMMADLELHSLRARVKAIRKGETKCLSESGKRFNGSSSKQ